jgi:hypothetical protein
LVPVERLVPDERVVPEARLVPDDRDELARVEPDAFAAVERDDDDERVEPDARELVERDDDERDDDERVVADDRDVVRRREPPLARRSEAGISSVATALVSCGRSFCRKAAMRSSCLRNSRASFSVSLSPTVLASASIAT